MRRAATIGAALLLAAMLAGGCGDAPTVDGGPAGSGGESPATKPVSAIPLKKLVVAEQSDFRPNPALGIDTSYRHLFVALEPDYSLEELNEVLAVAGGTLIGTVPSARLLQFEYPVDYTFAELNAKLTAIQAHGAVQAVAPDVIMSTTITPEPNVDAPGGGNWRTPADGNWGLEQIRAPLAWNLNKRAESNPKVKVTVIDAGFFAHDDLNISTSALGPGHVHGTAVAGIIGASWNGKFVDGVAPRTVLRGVTPTGWNGADDPTWATSFGAAVKTVVEALPGANRPRIVNMSLGYNWYINCFDRGGQTYPNGRCDPRLIPLLPDSGCNSGGVNALVAAQGQIFGSVVEALNVQANAPILFVTAAGNDSGAVNATPVDYCTNDCVCDNNAVACGQPMGTACVGVPRGMGNFPAHLASPMNWAAILHAGARPNMIVVEASARGAATWTVNRTSFSNVNSKGVSAPGHGIGVITDGTATSVGPGTSYASPFVAGAAAFLVSVQRDLSNPELKKLLIDPQYTDVVAVGMPAASTTTQHLNLFKAAMGIDDIRAGKKIRKWLADLDDGTDQGMQRYDRNDLNVKIGSGLSEDRQRDAGGLGLAEVDIRDFRRWRDSNLVISGALAPTVAPDDFGNRKRDLNFDGHNWPVVTAGLEAWPRAAFSNTHAISPSAAANGELALIKEVYQPLGIQKWPASALGDLDQSADLIIRAQDAITTLGADGILLRIVADDSDGLPASMAPHEFQLKGTAGLYGQGFYLPAGGPKSVWLTTPIFAGLRVRWAPVVNGQPPQPQDFITHEVPPLTPGHDEVLKLKSCGQPIDVKIQALTQSYQNATCTMQFNFCQCFGCLGDTVPIQAVASDPEGKPLSYKWKPTGICWISGSDQAALTNLSMSFSGPPACNTITNESCAVTLEVTDGCETAIANEVFHFACKATP